MISRSPGAGQGHPSGAQAGDAPLYFSRSLARVVELAAALRWNRRLSNHSRYRPWASSTRFVFPSAEGPHPKWPLATNKIILTLWPALPRLTKPD